MPAPIAPDFPLLYVSIRALRARNHSNPQHWLLCHVLVSTSSNSSSVRAALWVELRVGEPGRSVVGGADLFLLFLDVVGEGGRCGFRVRCPGRKGLHVGKGAVSERFSFKRVEVAASSMRSGMITCRYRMTPEWAGLLGSSSGSRSANSVKGPLQVRLKPPKRRPFAGS